MSFARVGIVSGVPAELAAFAPGIPRTERAIGGVRIAELNVEGCHVALLCLGIGKVAAAAAATLLARDCGAELLMTIGTAGSLGAPAGEVFLINEAVQADYGARRAGQLVRYPAGSWPIGPARLEVLHALKIGDCPLPTARIATSDMFIECTDHAAELAQALAATLVDMETGAVAQTAALLGLPWLAVKATTDRADAASAGDFQANLDRAARAAAEAAATLIARL